MAKSKKSGKSFKEQYSAYKTNSTRDKNKKAKMVRHLKLHPNDVQSSKGGNAAIRSTPKRKNVRINPFDVGHKGGKQLTLNLLSGKLIHNARLIMRFARMSKIVYKQMQFSSKSRKASI